MKENMKKLFSGGYAPLYKIINNLSPNKVSYLFGSCHVVPLNDLSLNKNNNILNINIHTIYKQINKQIHDTKDIQKEEDPIIDLLKNRKTLVTEPGNAFGSLSIHEVSDLMNTTYFYERLKKTVTQTTENKEDKENKITKLLLQHDIVWKYMKDKNLSEIGNILYNVACMKGIDYELIFHYMKENKPIYSLDQDKEMNNIQKSLNTYMNLVMLLAIVAGKLEKRSPSYMFQEALTYYGNKNYLQFSFDSEYILNSKTSIFLVKNRNKLWLPYIDRYHHELEDPLFVFGAAHLNGKEGLINLLISINYDVEVYHVGERRFLKV